MSLFGSIRMAGNTLRANEIGLQVVGQNISNANTPGYIREEVVFAPAPTQKYGSLLMGTGVDVVAIVEKLDAFLEQRICGALSDQSSTDSLQQTYAQLEGIVGELNENGLGAAMNDFFSSISEILNQPQDLSVRNLAVLQGDTLTRNINTMALQTGQLRADVNTQIANMAEQINGLTGKIANLNIQIAEAEGGNVSKSDAVGLRDQRLQALEELSKLIDIKALEQPSGTVTVYSGGDYLVNDGTARTLNVTYQTDRGLSTATLRIAGIDVPIDPSSGQLRGLLNSRDAVLGRFLDQLDAFAGTLAFEFNKVYSGGQGLTGYSPTAAQPITSQAAVDDATQPLNAAGLKFTPENGSFQVLVRNKQTGLTQTTNVTVNLSGLGTQTTLNHLTQQLDQVAGLSAKVTADGRLQLSATGQDTEFAFANDTSGALAALGINTLFTGSGARDLGINPEVRNDPSKFAASRGGIGVDAANAEQLAGFFDRPLDSQNGASISVLYDRLTSDVAQGSSVARAAADGAATFANTLNGQKLATSGVNLDEETINMLGYQQAYQAAAKYIATLNELLNVLTRL
jgi:flagellar hook-associated protein 1 FlgK